MSERKGFNAGKLAICGVSLALAFACSCIRLFHMPTGGSVTLCSMLFVTILGYLYGPVTGLIAAFSYSMLQFFQNPEFYSVFQVLFDYVFAFTALGISGFFRKQKNGLITGYLAAVFGRFIFATLASDLFWAEYLPENFPSPLIAAAVYNGCYLGAEALITVVILCLPPVKKLIPKLKKLA